MGLGRNSFATLGHRPPRIGENQMTDLYLILHKVRGEPALDIASAIMIGEEQCWLIPTSGHRAYPIDWLALNAVCPDTVENMLVAANGPIWEALSDHYE